MNIDQFHPKLLKAGIAYHDADWNWKNVRSPFFRIYYVVKGEASIEVKGKLYELRQGNIYVIPPFVLHSTSCTGKFVHYYIHVYNDVAEEGDLFAEYDIPVCIHNVESTMPMFARILELNPDLQLTESNPLMYDNNRGLQESILMGHKRSFKTHLETRSIIYLIILELLKQSKYKERLYDSRIKRAIEYINAHLSEPHTTTALANLACISTEHFIRLFKKAVNYSPIQYVNNKRMERAQVMLVTSDMPVGRIAEEVGFHDLAYFVKSFKKLTGMSPSRYKEEAKKQR